MLTNFVTQTRFRVLSESPAYLGQTPLKAEDATQQLGLTNTHNGPQSSGGALPEVLNNQVMYNPFVEPIGCALIGWELTNIENDDDTISDDNFFFPNNDDEEEGSESTEAPHSLIVNDEEGNDIDVDDSHCDTNMAIMTPNARRHVSDKLMVKIKLMNFLQNHSIPLVAEKELCEWAIELERTRSRVLREISTTVPERKGDGFEPHLIGWCSKKSTTSDVPICKEIYILSFQEALHSLLTNVTLVKEENLSFPHAEDPTLPVRFLELQGNVDIDELHHGEWWINTWGKRCKRDLNKILVPIILYMDGIVIDNSGQSTLTPLNMTLGIFHPTGSRDKGNKSIDNVNNLHSGLHCALSSLKEACNLTDGIKWSILRWNKKKWSVRMKFAVTYFISDTPQHDQLCGHYQTANTKMISLGNNSCVNVLKIPVSIKSRNMQVINHKNGEEYQSVWLWKMFNFTSPTVEEGVNVEQYFKNVSHHRVHNYNVFHDLDFGENPHKIHLASPGERLHMHQLAGCAKRATETFCEDFLGNNTRLLGEMDRIASYYGGAVQRQSNQDFPQTNFSESKHTTKKEGNQYIDMLYIQMLTLLSAEEIDGHIYALELLLGMEEFLKYAGTFDEAFKEDNNGVLNLDKMVVHFINCINNYLQEQSKGEGNNLDSKASESNHKTEVKAPAKRTQQIKSTIIKQTCNHPTEGSRSAGSKFLISVRDGLPYMKWDEKKNASVPWFPSDVLKFCCDVVLPAAGTNTLRGSTEHKRYDNYRCMGLLFCTHPSFKSDSRKLPNIWYGWANFQLDLLDRRGLSVSGFELVHNGYYAVACRCFLSVDPILSKRAEGRTDCHALVKQDVLHNKLYLFDCNAIESEVAVV
eukprot:jgi/Psemu1/52906/gm1.52906_g